VEVCPCFTCRGVDLAWKGRGISRKISTNKFF
jgi:hypothetical protein